MQVLLPDKTEQKPWLCEHPWPRVLAADAIGAAVLAVLWSILAVLLGHNGLSPKEWTVFYLVTVLLALGSWHVSNTPKLTTKQALFWAVKSIFIGAAFFLLDILSGHSSHPTLPLWKAGMEAGTPFGFLFTLAMCPWATFLFTADAVRIGFLHRGSQCDA